MIGEILRNGRNGKILTVSQVSKLTRIDGALITKFELGNRVPTEAQILALSQLYDIEPAEMLGERIKMQIRKILINVENPSALLSELLKEFNKSETAEPTMREVMAEIEMLKKNLLSNKS